MLKKAWLLPNQLACFSSFISSLSLTFLVGYTHRFRVFLDGVSALIGLFFFVFFLPTHQPPHKVHPCLFSNTNKHKQTTSRRPLVGRPYCGNFPQLLFLFPLQHSPPPQKETKSPHLGHVVLKSSLFSLLLFPPRFSLAKEEEEEEEE